ncbi:hypothetical protein FA014_13945 [Cellulomonas hominis]|uniref:DUF3558 domain-containing protein n=1 Tax=Cellulomonas hominis TaxID=156981 RepID=A0A7Z8NNU8_9CELL|nr:hypothetical protein [Cellulomonas hominis]TKR22910.1 hypothetical protein FA014_13945 [Cellulomonas hominis]
MRAWTTSGGGALVVLAALLLTGCGSGEGSAPADDGAAGGAGAVTATDPAPAATDAEAAPEAPAGDGLPTCDEVKAALGPAVAGLVELPGSENGVTEGVDGPELGCAWHTTQTGEASLDLENYGGLSVGVLRDPTFTEDSMGTLGWGVEDPRLDAAGAWALKPGGGYDPAAQLDVTGLQVVRDGVVVVLTAGGVALQDVPELSALTHDWALGGGLAVLDVTGRA